MSSDTFRSVGNRFKTWLLGFSLKAKIVLLVALVVGIASFINAFDTIYSKFNSLFEESYDLDVHYRNLIIVPIDSSNQGVNGKFGIFLYNLTIVNINNPPSTIKEVTASAKIGESWLSTKLYSIRTGTDLGMDNSMVLVSERDTIFAGNWENIRTKIALQSILPKGGTLNGSAVFVLDTNMENPKKISELRITITDFSKNRFDKHIKLDAEAFMAFDNHFRAKDRSFRQLDDHTIEWEKE